MWDLLYNSQIVNSAENKNLIRPAPQLRGEVRSTLVERPPVVVIMGHVDHGKTKLLDYIRLNYEKAAPEGGEPRPVSGREAGGITQHIGAYEISYKNRKITFLDTPGHEAFSKLRSRGAKAADIAVLVIAADDGVKPQTLEALEHIKKAGLPFIVAINKIDKPESNIEKVKKELAENEVLIESWGGKIPSVEISAKEGKNINELLELIELLADLNEFKADQNKTAEGIVIETKLDPRRGMVASLLILEGTLEVGDYILSGLAQGKIKILEDFLGNQITKATFSSPVVTIGWNELPLVGVGFSAEKVPFTPALKAAKKIGELIERVTKMEEEKIENVIYAIIKADVASSAEALKESLQKIKFSAQGGSASQGETDEGAFTIKILKSEAGNVSENDLKTALVSNAIIIAFNVKIDPSIALVREKVTLVSGNIIYEVLDKTKKIIEERLKPKAEREEIGRIQVLAIFRQEKSRQVVGGKIISGEAVKGVRVEILRSDSVIGQGRIVSLQSEKKETGKIETGKEAGIAVDMGEPKIAAGDIIILFKKLT